MNAMRSIRLTTFTILFVSALVVPARVRADIPYRFRVISMELDAYVLDDAAVRLEYKIKFANQPAAHIIDIVDVGLPHSGYSRHSMKASVDGKPVRKIRPSEYIAIGVECHLGASSIPPSQTGTFEFSCRMPDMVYSDTTDAEYASFQIRPTWFDPQLQIGTTELKVALHLPPGIKAEEVRYQQEKERYALATWGEGADEHVVAFWKAPQMTLSRNNPKFSVSFPRRVMKRVIEQSKLELFLDWFDGNEPVKMVSGGLLFVLLGLFFYRFSRGTGCILFFLCAGMLALAMFSSPAMHLLCWPAMLGLVGLNEWYLGTRKPPTYLPAMATVEGGGIKRGLTAPQAAVLLEEPLGKVLTMVIFGLLKKRVVKLVSEDPATVTVVRDYVCPRKARRKRAAKNGVVIHDYEHPFLDQLQAHRGSVEECDLNEALGKLVKTTADRMKGFDIQRTREYYRRIVKRAWKDAGSIGEIEQRDVVVDRNFEWMMMEEDWIDLFDVWRRRGYTYYPRWSRPTWSTRGGGVALPSGGSGGAGGGGTGGTAGGPSGGGAGSGSPTFGEVAGSFVGWAENTAGRMAQAIEPASMNLGIDKLATVDLSGVDKATSSFFDALAEAGKSSGGGGGGGGGCACACAGCACACACAGGGR